MIAKGERCASWCGRGCTEKEYQSAEKNAEMLARKLGKDWTPRVWENLGWHFSASSPCGRVAVYPSGTHYLAMLGEPHSHAGRWSETGRTPSEAVKGVLEKARGEITALDTLVEGLEDESDA